MRLEDRSVFFKSPGPGQLAHAYAFYTHRDGIEKMAWRSILTRSDTVDYCHRLFSCDNGRTWSEPESIPVFTRSAEGTRRQYYFPGFPDPTNDRLVTAILEGVLPTDDPLEGLKTWYLKYAVSTDGGRTNAIEEQIIQKGPYTPEHPCHGVWVGKNSVMLGDLGSGFIRTRAGKILLPVQTSPIGPDGEYYNPGGGYTYHECAVFIGTWKEGLRIEWEMSQVVANEPDVSTRGAIEPTLAELPDGRILMVIRGSNDVKPHLPGYKWYSISGDGGYTWSRLKPWTYTDGTRFFSPSSCSQLLAHSNGKYYWLGNITPENPKGNGPRYPFVIAEVDPKSGLLRRDTVFVADDRQRGEDERMFLSNFLAHEDRENGDIVLHMYRAFIIGSDGFEGDSYLYRIRP